ncbi:3'(2'),5'-bisphosphate nucleotidase CysQ [Marinospirillum perlucidum]|uniref:3'(2'),5'-bisphosphate nucleotidase CysQ n=1 Tax=Marinospirillum perlucidum TaxID=1982602 RepID=UPI000DF135C9|nr:3'(2'),5'-bisphosphate nucleotidase CysQ [Marinospirillum perlucidum]
MQNSELLSAIEGLARQAGQAIMKIYNREFEITQKEDASPLTEADSAAHHLIVEGLEALGLGIPILSEEDLAAFSGTDQQGRYWLVDPLDGTKEFIKHNGEFTVNIALIEKGKPLLGVVDAPACQWAYSAIVAEGANKIIYNAEGEELERQAIQVETLLPKRWRVVGSRSHLSDSMKEWLERLQDFEILPMGSSLKLCRVAEGLADIYPRLGPTSLWDTAAAQAVVEAAGGVVVTLNGKPLDYSSPQETLNPSFLVVAKNNLSSVIN